MSSLNLASLDTRSDSGPVISTPKKLGILRLPATPGTGQSVRFGMREYDDGDESKMSNSTANNSSLSTSPLKYKQDVSEDSIEISLGYIRSPSNHTLADIEDEDGSEEMEDTSRQTFQTAPPSPFCQQSTSPILDEVLREAEELDQLHSERSEVLLSRVKQAEDDLEMTRRLLHLEKERSTKATEEAEAARARLQKMKEEAQRVESQQSKRMHDLEELTSRLDDQLDKQRETSIVTDGQMKEGATQELEEKIALLERQLEQKSDEKERARKAQEESDNRIQDIALDHKQVMKEKEKLQTELDDVRRSYNEYKQQSDAAYLSLQEKHRSEADPREYDADNGEEEIQNLQRQLTESKEEQKALQDALVSAQKQIGSLQGDDYQDKEALACTTDELAAIQRQLGQVQSALVVSQQELQAVKDEREALVKDYSELKDINQREKAHWQKKHEQMVNENDNLLQSLVEAEEHRIAMENDVSNKRESNLLESRQREEEAINLAQEMQSRLERVESRLEAMTIRTSMLEHEVGDRGIQLMRLEKAKERLEEDNLNYSIALSSKQQELSLLKRNTNRSQRNTPASIIHGKLGSSQRPSIASSRTLLSSVRRPLGETQAGDESASSLAPLQSGPLNVKTMRRKTMDVDTPSACPISSAARSTGQAGRTSRVSLALPTPSTAKLVLLHPERRKSTKEETKAIGPPSRTSSQASHRSSGSAKSSMLQSSRAPSIQSSSVTVQVKSNLSSSILASEGPMDISELQTDQDAANIRQRLLDRSRDLQRARVSASLPSRARSSMGPVLV